MNPAVFSSKNLTRFAQRSSGKTSRGRSVAFHPLINPLSREKPSNYCYRDGLDEAMAIIPEERHNVTPVRLYVDENLGEGKLYNETVQAIRESPFVTRSKVIVHRDIKLTGEIQIE